MNKSFAFFVILSSIFMSSCQKEIKRDDDILANDLLVKIVQKGGADSIVTNYTYDAENRLMLEKTTGMFGGTNRDNEFSVFRNGSGIITKTVEKAAYLMASGVDSLPTRFNYNTTTGRYSSSVLELNQSGISVVDSVAYEYDIDGRIIRDNHFQFVTGIPFTQIFKQEYVYSASGNVDSVKQFSYDMVASSYSLSSTTAFRYDIKVNPLIIGVEATLLYRFPFLGPNNAVSTEAVFLSSPTPGSSSNTTFIYNTSNKPVTAIMNEMPSGRVSNVSYFYQ